MTRISRYLQGYRNSLASKAEHVKGLEDTEVYTPAQKDCRLVAEDAEIAYTGTYKQRIFLEQSRNLNSCSESKVERDLLILDPRCQHKPKSLLSSSTVYASDSLVLVNNLAAMHR